jgi:hypothetical protein
MQYIFTIKDQNIWKGNDDTLVMHNDELFSLPMTTAINTNKSLFGKIQRKRQKTIRHIKKTTLSRLLNNQTKRVK